MFRIYDGRDKLFQWDSNIKLIVEDNSINQVHFCNRTDDCSLVCETYTENGVMLVDVPNILLTTDWKIKAYAFDTNYTKYEKCFDVVSRTKPTDYIYTETEILSYSTLAERVEALEEGSGSGVTKEYVDNSIYQVNANIAGVGAIATEAKTIANQTDSKATAMYNLLNNNKQDKLTTEQINNINSIGDIENALDEIIAIQEALIGGNG